MDLTPDQISQLQSLGISANKPVDQTIPSNHSSQLLNKQKNPLVPLLSISGLTLISFGGLILFKGKSDNQITSSPAPYTNPQIPSPTQVPKSIQHYLLTSQQLFTQALQAQNSQTSTSSTDLLNQSILAATAAIQQYPQDYRGYEQRARIYQSLIESNPKLLANAVSDLTTATKLNPSSPEITRTLATLYAKAGDVQNTLAYLTQTISLEPTKAQNFYDLARLQTQAGYISQALDTYNRLLTIVADPTQKNQVETEKTSLEKLASQNPNQKSPPLPPTIPPLAPPSDSPLLQANLGTDTGLIIAAPETSQDISIKSLTDTNSLSGTSTLPANTPSITLTNTNLTSTSQVYLTVTKGGKNQSLQVISKSTESFVVGLDSPISEPIEFKWWIVN